TSRLQAIEAIDRANRRIVVQAAAVNQRAAHAGKAAGLPYPTPPASHPPGRNGGNAAQSSGRPHTPQHGAATNHVRGGGLVAPSGGVGGRGGAVEARPGYDLTGGAVGAEGTFGIVTRATLRLVRTPESYRTLLAVFESIEAASETVSGIIAAGIVPAALEMMDQLIVGAVEAAYRICLPTDAGAVLRPAIDRPETSLHSQLARIAADSRAHGSAHRRGALS